MSFEIYPDQEICNVIGKSIVTVDTISVQDGYITVGNYYVPLGHILFIKEIS